MQAKFIKIGVLLALLLLIASGVYVFMNYRETITKTVQTVQNTITNQSIKVEEKKITDNTSPFTINISYPFIANEDGFNQTVKDFIDNQLNNFKDVVIENDAAVKEVDPEGYKDYPREYPLTITYEQGEVNKEFASFLFNVSEYTGGAHGNAYSVSINYDLAKNKELELADFFPNQKEYLQKVSDYCVQDLTKQITERDGTVDGTWIPDGAGPDEDNYLAFLVKKDTITFYFAPYQIAPYAAGDFKVVMPR